MPSLSPQDRAALRQYLTDRFSQDELNELAFDLGVDAETLSHETKGEFARALINHFEDRGEAVNLVREVQIRRPDPVMQMLLEKLQSAPPDDQPLLIADQPSVREQPETAPRTKLSPIASPMRWVLPAALLVTAVVIAAIVISWLGSTDQLESPTATEPSSLATDDSSASSVASDAESDVASDLPGTPLTLNSDASSGIDDQIKPRDVWRTTLQGQKRYSLEIRAEGYFDVFIMRPATQRLPENFEGADIKVCSASDVCAYAFTAPLSGDYYIVVDAQRQLVNYTLSVNEK